jgi:hypothetical protein
LLQLRAVPAVQAFNMKNNAASHAAKLFSQSAAASNQL